MRAKIRILPIVILAAMMLLGVKVVELGRGVANFGFATALAQSGGAKGKQGGSDKAKPGGVKTASPMAETENPADKSGANTGADGAKASPGRRKIKRKTKFTEAEIEVLQRLSGRREALQQRSRQMALREKILQATEKRIDGKIAELKKLEGRIQKLLIQYDEEAEKRIKSLVKVYESMKPKEAARIFEQLKMDILLSVTERMKEVKMAKVMAAMDPKKAETLTVKLATRRRLPKTGG